MSDFLYAVSLLDLRLNMENANDDDGSGSNDSTVIEGTAKTQRSRKDRVDKRKGQKGVQSRIRSAAAALKARVHGDDSSDGSCSPPPPKKKGHTKSSVIWKHCQNKEVRGRIFTYCNYCPNVSWELKGSTSTALSHVKQHHFDKLTHDERNDLMDKIKGTTSP